MRFLVVSDTHGETSGLALVLDRLGRSVDGLIHCGDGAADIPFLLEAMNLRLPLHLVRGNTDSSPAFPQLRPVHVAERKLLLAHGHHFLKGDSYALFIAEAVRQQACAFLYGHTHIPSIDVYSNILLLNPGSLSRPRGSWGPSFAVMDVPEEKGCWIDVRFFELQTRGRALFKAFRP